LTAKLPQTSSAVRNVDKAFINSHDYLWGEQNYFSQLELVIAVAATIILVSVVVLYFRRKSK
jgi:hypothetical protein